MDIIEIQGLQVQTIIGCFNWERQLKQTLTVDLQCYTSISKAANSDAIADAVNYATLGEQLSHHIASQSFYLLEALAESAAAWLLQAFAISKVRLKITKVAALANAASVAVIIERSKAT